MPKQARPIGKTLASRPPVTATKATAKKVASGTPVTQVDSAGEPKARNRQTAGSVDAAKTSKPSKDAKTPKSSSKDGKAAKLRKALVRDSFTMPVSDFALIDQLKARAMGHGRVAKKSELLRAGLQALASLDPRKLLTALERLEPVKVGRPRQST